MRTPTINKEELIQSLRKLYVDGGISYREMERKSGVYNVSRIVSGEIKKPTAESWQLLHEAYPLDIPEPSYIGGDKVYKNITADHNSNAAGRSIINPGSGIVLSAEEQAIVNALRSFGDAEARVIRKLLGMIDDIAENIQK